jgi:hypothetical protein
MGGAAQGVEVGGSGIGGTVAAGVDPSHGQADVIVAGGGVRMARVSRRWRRQLR